MATDDKTKTKKDQFKGFTVDPENTQHNLPSVTQLLNRKRLSNAAAPDKQPKVRRAGSRRGKAPPPAKLLIWDPARLKTSKDPLSQGLLIALQKGVISALFLKNAPSAEKDAPPVFRSTAIAGRTDRRGLWKGLMWYPSTLPEVWTSFVQVGRIEFAPPDGVTNLKSNRNLIRSAFGALPQEWVTLIRVGPKNKIRGAIVLLATRSLMVPLSEALPFFFKPI